VVNPDGTASVLGDPSVGPYDGGDDTLVGVQNDSSSSVIGLKLSSTLPIFDFDGDGLCSGLFSPTPAGCPFGTTGYEGPNTTFTPASSTIGNVNFTGGLPAGGTTYFSLESVVQAAQLLVNTTHYRIDLKAWIPQAKVVDPEQPISLSYLTAAVIHFPCYTPSFLLIPFTIVTTDYRGDNHVGFDGSYRVQSTVEFDWDTKKILNVTVLPDPDSHYGTSHLEATYSNFLNTNTCVLATGTATRSTAASASGSSFNLTYSSANPLVRIPFTPTIDGLLSGTIAANGTINLNYRTDLFPSHGFRVTKDGSAQRTDTVSDASCLLTTLGIPGLAFIGAGLSAQINSGSRTVAPGDSGLTASTRSRLCLP
jgi:hypothetical protein